MNIKQVRTCPLCQEYMRLKGYRFDSAKIDQTRLFREGKEPSAWRHTTRLGKFMHSQAEKHPRLAGTQEG